MNIIDNDPLRQLEILANAPYSRVNKNNGKFEEINLLQFIGQKIQSFFDLFRNNKNDYANSKLKEYKLIQLLQSNAYAFGHGDVALIKKAASRCGLVDSNALPLKHLELYKTIRKIQSKFDSAHLNNESYIAPSDNAEDYFHNHISALIGYSFTVLKVVNIASTILPSQRSPEPTDHQSPPPASPPVVNEESWSDIPLSDSSDRANSGEHQDDQNETSSSPSTPTPPASSSVSEDENSSDDPSGVTSHPVNETPHQDAQNETDASGSMPTPPPSSSVSEDENSSSPPSDDTSHPVNETPHQDAQNETDASGSMPTPPAASSVSEDESPSSAPSDDTSHLNGTEHHDVQNESTPSGNDSSSQDDRQYTHIRNEDLNAILDTVETAHSTASPSSEVVSNDNDGNVAHEALRQLQSRIQDLKENKDTVDSRNLIHLSREIKREIKNIQKLPDVVDLKEWTMLYLQASALYYWAKQNDRLKYLQGVLQHVSPDDSCDLLSYNKLKQHVEANAKLLDQLNSIVLNPMVHFPSDEVVDLDSEDTELINDLDFDLSFVPMERDIIAKYLKERMTQKYDQMSRESELIQTELIRAFWYSKYKAQRILSTNELAAAEKQNYIERLDLFKEAWNGEKLVRRGVCIEDLLQRIEEIKELYDILYSTNADTKHLAFSRSLNSTEITDEQINKLCSFNDDRWLELFHEVAGGFTTWDAALPAALDPLSSSISQSNEGSRDRYLNTSSQFLAAVRNAPGSRFSLGDIETLQVLLKGGADTLRKVFDPQTNIDRLVETWNNGTDEERESLFVAISWVLTYIAQQKNQMFKEGAYIIDDPDDRLFNFISRITGVYNRLSSHLNQMTPNSHRGFDIANQWKLMPEHCGHVLFTSMIDQNLHRVFLKPEQWGVSGVKALAGHALDYLYSLERRYNPNNEGANEAEGFRKERVPKSLLTDFNKLVEGFSDALALKQEAEVHGIRAMVRIIENKIQQTSSEEWNVKANEFLTNIRTNYDHIENRIGQEVIITIKEMEKAIYNINNNL